MLYGRRILQKDCSAALCFETKKQWSIGDKRRSLALYRSVLTKQTGGLRPLLVFKQNWPPETWHSSSSQEGFFRGRCYVSLPSMVYSRLIMYRSADKSLAQPGMKQARKHVRDACDFHNIETRAVIKFFFPARQGAEGNSRHSDRNSSLFSFWSG